ncbi:MAG: DegT/DnrJ/EryC1/StrS family aminotransferase [Bacteroidia bacterium]
MNYYFPSILTDLNFKDKSLSDSFLTVNSGENAIRLLLRSYSLKPGAKVALPVFVCDSLKESVLKEGFTPLYLDLKPDGTFWTDYSEEALAKEKPSAAILVHLYGFIHPDTERVMKYCSENSIRLIHDTAQSYGIDETKFTYSNGIVYSFGPGKSSTAAGGAIVKGLDKIFYSANCTRASDFSIQNFTADLFLKSRLYGHEFSFRDKILSKIISRIGHSRAITSMTFFQRAAAAKAIQLVGEKASERKVRYNILEQAVRSNAALSIPYNDGNGLYFKMVLSAGNEVERFKDYLRGNNVPFFSLKSELQIGKEDHDHFKEFSKSGGGFVELSSEASLPLEEIKRVAGILGKYS